MLDPGYHKNELARVSECWRDTLEVIEQTFKPHPNGVGVPVESIVAPALYVLDWLPDREDRFDGIKVEHVVSIEDLVVNLIDSTTDIDTFASIVVGGPFRLD